MSKETMERIVGRAVTNREYRERLLARPEEALKGYHLTDEEMCRVKDWTNRTFEMLIHDLERQVDGLRFDGSAGFRVPDDDRPRPPGREDLACRVEASRDDMSARVMRRGAARIIA